VHTLAEHFPGVIAKQPFSLRVRHDNLIAAIKGNESVGDELEQRGEARLRHG